MEQDLVFRVLGARHSPRADVRRPGRCEAASREILLYALNMIMYFIKFKMEACSVGFDRTHQTAWPDHRAV